MAEDILSLALPERAIPFIAEKLEQGVVALFVGAGVSEAVGLPGWEELTRRCAIDGGVTIKDLEEKLQNKDYEAIIAEIENAVNFGEYAELVREALYKDFAGMSITTCGKELLIALGAMVFGQYRGGVRDIISLNFDDVLESYFSLHGYDVQSIWSLPRLTRGNSVRIFHIHGFLSGPGRPTAQSPFLLFSRRSADERISDKSNAMKETITHVLMTKLCVFIGMSEKTAMDYLLGPLLHRVGRKTERHSRPTGFWLFGEGPRGERRPVSQGVKDFLAERNVVPIVLPSYEDVAMFLFKVCGLTEGDGVGVDYQPKKE